MNGLVLPLATVGEKGMAVDVVVPGPSLRPAGVEDLALGAVAVRGMLTTMGAEFLFRGHITGTYENPCDRCLDASSIPFDYAVAWFFEPGPRQIHGEERREIEVDDEDLPRYFDGNEIDLKGHVWEEVVVQAPHKFLCSENCKGLCPECGANWNRTSCDCARREQKPGGSSGLSVLADLFPDLRPKED